MTVALPLASEAIHDTFRGWHAQRESLDAQLSESLAALEAYQSHLDAWQKQLACERDELRQSREALDRDRSALNENQVQLTAEATAELNAAREKVVTLTDSLVARTDELRVVDNRRAELVAELESSRAREGELRAALDEQKRTIEQERAHWAEEFRRLRELLERQLESPPAEQVITPPERIPAPAKQSRSAAVVAEGHSANPVLGSIVEQFGKLRQQRAVDRQANKRTR
jgi:DNA repair exonuclease SbcCD ATPase subunit